jgi:hypothetical protein
VPARPAQSVCTSTQIGDYFSNSCQFGGCVEYEAGGALEACGQCLSPSDVDDAAYGPVIRVAVGSATLVETNSAGCVELAGQVDCAASFQARDACLREACLRTCSPGERLFGTCMDDARTSSCAAYASPGACLLLATAEACSGDDVFALVATVFCGGG